MKEPQYTTDDYVAAFDHIAVAPHHVRMLQAHYHAPDRTLTATQMAKAVGYPNFSSANLHYGILGRVVGTALGWNPLPTTLVYVLAEFQKPAREWFWILRPSLAAALERLGWVGGERPSIPEEIEITAPFYEGAVRKIAVNAYERNGAARAQCILHHGCHCTVCGLTLAVKYGEVAQGLIHVHHLRQLADVNAEYRVDPIRDLRPVCPTCHAVIHTRTPPFTIEEISQMIERQNEENCEQSPAPIRGPAARLPEK